MATFTAWSAALRDFQESSAGMKSEARSWLWLWNFDVLHLYLRFGQILSCSRLGSKLLLELGAFHCTSATNKFQILKDFLLVQKKGHTMQVCTIMINRRYRYRFRSRYNDIWISSMSITIYKVIYIYTYIMTNLYNSTRSISLHIINYQQGGGSHIFCWFTTAMNQFDTCIINPIVIRLINQS